MLKGSDPPLGEGGECVDNALLVSWVDPERWGFECRVRAYKIKAFDSLMVRLLPTRVRKDREAKGFSVTESGLD